MSEKKQKRVEELISKYVKNVLSNGSDKEFQLKERTIEDKRLKKSINYVLEHMISGRLKASNENYSKDFLKWVISKTEKDKNNILIENVLDSKNLDEDVIFCCIKKVTKNLLLETILDNRYLKDDEEVNKIRELVNDKYKDAKEQYIESKYLDDDVIKEEIKKIIDIEYILQNEHICRNDGLMKWIINNVNKDDLLVESIFGNDNLSDDVILCTVKRVVKDGIDINKKYSNGETLLIKAAKRKKISKKAIEYICRLGYVDVNCRDNNGMTAMHYLLKCDSKYVNRLSCMENLLRYGADVTIKDNSGREPISYINWKEEDVCISFIDDLRKIRHYVIEKLVENGASQEQINSSMTKRMKNEVGALKKAYINMKALAREIIKHVKVLASIIIILGMIVAGKYAPLKYTVDGIFSVKYLYDNFYERKRKRLNPSLKELFKEALVDLLKLGSVTGLILGRTIVGKMAYSLIMVSLVCVVAYFELKKEDECNKLFEEYLKDEECRLNVNDEPGKEKSIEKDVGCSIKLQSDLSKAQDVEPIQKNVCDNKPKIKLDDSDREQPMGECSVDIIL